MEYCVKDSNRKAHDNFMSNLKGETVISTLVYGLLLFLKTSRKRSVIYPLFYDIYLLYGLLYKTFSLTLTEFDVYINANVTWSKRSFFSVLFLTLFFNPHLGLYLFKKV